VVRLGQVRRLGQALQRLEMRGQPLAVRALGGEGVLELGVVIRTRSGGMSSTPTSDAMTTSPSLVT